MSVSNHRKASNGHAPKASRPQKRRAAFYDLDGTLVDLNLVHAAVFTLANVGEWSGRVSYLLGFAARIPRLYVAEQRDRRLLNTVLFEAFKGVSRVISGSQTSPRTDLSSAAAAPRAGWQNR